MGEVKGLFMMTPFPDNSTEVGSSSRGNGSICISQALMDVVCSMILIKYPV